MNTLEIARRQREEFDERVREIADHFGIDRSRVWPTDPTLDVVKIRSSEPIHGPLPEGWKLVSIDSEGGHQSTTVLRIKNSEGGE